MATLRHRLHIIYNLFPLVPPVQTGSRGEKYGRVTASDTGWNVTPTRMPSYRSSAWQPMMALISQNSSSSRTMAGAYGTLNDGSGGRQTTVQLYNEPNPAVCSHSMEVPRHEAHTVDGRSALTPHDAHL